MKRQVRLFILAILFLFIGNLINFTSAQGGDAPGLGDVIGKNASAIIGDLSSGDTDFLLNKLKELFLENKFISKMDTFFKKINGVFVFLFAQNYSFSLEMFFVVVLWLLTFFSLLGYAEAFIINKGYCLASSLAATIILSWMKIFNFVSLWFVNFVFYKADSFLFSFFTFLLIFVLLFSYIYINKMFAGRIKKDKEKERQKRIEIKVATQGKFIEGMKQ